MKKIIRLSTIFSLILLVSCQSSKKTSEGTVIEKFPEDWVGEWEGNLEIFNAKGKMMDVYMGLNILPISDSTYTWTIIYGKGEQQDRREYEIKPKDKAKGHYVVDEKNSIILDNYLYGNTLYSRFEVQDNLLLISYEKLGENIIFEVISGKMDNPNITGGQDSIPEVKSYPVSIGQKAILKRKK